MDLNKRNKGKTQKQRPKIPEEAKCFSLEKIARGKVIYTSDFIFQVRLSKNKNCYFREEDASFYNKPEAGIKVRCIYRRDKDISLPYEVYDLLWNPIWKEK
jgi:hypothetical protein